MSLGNHREPPHFTFNKQKVRGVPQVLGSVCPMKYELERERRELSERGERAETLKEQLQDLSQKDED